MNSKTRQLLFFCVICIVALCGCGAEKPEWQKTVGTVTFQGEPVGQAEVLFYSQSSTFTRIANTDSRGHFECKTHLASGLPVGEYQVVVRPIFIDPVVSGENWEPGDSIPPMSRQDIPQQYQQRTTTNLTIEVVEGENDLNIVLED